MVSSPILISLMENPLVHLQEYCLHSTKVGFPHGNINIIPIGFIPLPVNIRISSYCLFFNSLFIILFLIFLVTTYVSHSFGHSRSMLVRYV